MQIQKLYAIERYILEHEVTGKTKRKHRQEHAVPISTEMESCLKQEYAKVLPANAIGVAIAYSLKRWDRLSLYATNGILHIDHNPVENSYQACCCRKKELPVCRQPCHGSACCDVLQFTCHL